ncbi:MAG: histidinol dehydrogenase [Peptococcaceae bacterium]|jgi:histidinol dehydrogenase|nr:histidinol dehydrogenase [Peptococcaceae bacterium]MBQ2004805.1 histidinol dehydrogenase [Peptococcaceae bacterium]MBQ2021415.1 histidinol dehydrogenase [Peptococcaceae bacterium]MBQ2369257.1 histidinol dehydrogenase [Peptococcaceae bacterium]MBQ5368743.1 histidinol dehydrogenase [Peptococcaceae bacterium]
MISITIADGSAEKALLNSLRQRSGETDKKVTASVTEILETVKARGDEAVKEYTLKFDGRCPEHMEVTRAQMDQAVADADPRFVEALTNAMENIKEFHSRQKQQSFIDAKPNGVIMGQRIRGLKRVGLYVPGGTAAYPSSVLMNAVPAKIAGVEEIIMVTPPLKDGTANPDILVAAALAGVDRIFLMGGAQAVAALAYGTETIPKVDKIVGPGNIYVATAKRILYGVVDIDMIAGPSEILVMADSTANPKFLAADLMSQAEHDVLASSILLTTDQTVAEETMKELERQMALLSRNEIIEKSLRDYGAIIVCRSVDEMVDMANELAPEHLEVMMENPLQYLGRLDNAGSVFLGQYAPEPLGDYYAGPNHVLPTSGTARFFSPLGVDSFIKKSSYIYYTEDALRAAHDDIVCIAEREQLTAHANSIKVRFEREAE